MNENENEQQTTANTNPKPDEPKDCGCTSGNCLTLDCNCFKHGRFCKECHNPNCENNEEHSEKRIAAMEEFLSSNPMAFTGEDTLNQDECAAIFNFAMLTASVDVEKFQAKPRDPSISRLLNPKIVHQAIQTVMSSVNEDLAQTDKGNFEEKTENNIASEFNNVLNTLIQHLRGHI